MAAIIFPDDRHEPMPKFDRFISSINIDQNDKKILLDYNDKLLKPISASLSCFTNFNEVHEMIVNCLSVVDETFDPSTAEDGIFYFVKKNQ